MVILKLTAIGMVKLMDFQMERLKLKVTVMAKLTVTQMDFHWRWGFVKDWLRQKEIAMAKLMEKLMEIR